VNQDRSPLGLVLLIALVVAVIVKALGLISQQSLDHVFLFLVAWGLFGITRKMAPHPAYAAIFAMGAVACLAGLQLWMPSLQYTPYLVIAPANLVMAYVFARGLIPGRQPVLLQLVRAMGKGPVDDRRFQHFVAGQCALWGLLTSATAILATLAMVFGATWPWISDVLTPLILFQIAWFVLSHYYASLRYNRTETWRNTLQVMTRPDIWSRLGS